MGLRKYFTLTRMGIIEALHYRLSLYVKIIGNLLYLILIYYLWKAIFHSAGTDVVNGMTFALSEPLVDGCAEIREYELTGDSIAKALLA